jgi:hypothetical protein
MLIDGMPKAHDFFFIRQLLQHSRSGLLARVIPFDECHGRLVRAAMQRSAQSSNRSGDTRIEV